MESKPQATNLLPYLFLLTSTFSLFQIAFMLQTSGFYFGDAKFIANHISIPIKVIPGILYFLTAQLFLQICYTLLIWICVRFTGKALNLSWQSTQRIGFIFWILITLFILFANIFYFPNSKYADLFAIFLTSSAVKFFYYLLMIPSIALVLFAILGIVDFLLQRKKIHYLFLSILILLLTLTMHRPIQPVTAATAEHPNIILIGVDAVRPDFLSYFGREEQTPHFDAFLNQSFVFGEALTPLARTFPSWVSILTGQYPKETNARFDLTAPQDLLLPETLPQILKQHGYATIYGMDDTRFSNITKKFGFDKFVMPPVGFNDFLLGTLNDFPLSNLIINTKLGKWLFPYSYGNRAAFITYQPNTFITMWKDALTYKQNKPLFIAVHFCLPHYPYFWAGSHDSKNLQINYLNSIQEMDKQFGDFLSLLQKQNLLQHSIVVLLSDHGETLEFEDDRITRKEMYIPGSGNSKHIMPHFYPANFAKEEVNKSAGHGTDVLGLPQYHSVLAFHLQGITNNAPHLVSGLVNLMQIKPTILNLLRFRREPNGLESILQGKVNRLAMQQDFFMESDFSPEAIRSVHPETKKILFEGIDFFQIDRQSARITIKPSMGQLIISSKQYADIYHDWMLALYPEANHHYLPILVNLKTGEWTDDINADFAKQSPYQHMITALKNFYKNDISIS